MKIEKMVTIPVPPLTTYNLTDLSEQEFAWLVKVVGQASVGPAGIGQRMFRQLSDHMSKDSVEAILRNMGIY